VTGRCIIVGDVMLDVSTSIDTEIALASDTPARIALLPGGAASNTSTWMASAGHEVTLIGCVGDDAFGRHAREVLLSAGVDARLSNGVRATGACVVLVDRHHERTMFPDPGANLELTAEQVTSVLEPDSHLHMSGYTMMNEPTRPAALAAIHRAREIGATVSVDPASSAPLLRHRVMMLQACQSVDVLLLNEAEAIVLSGASTVTEALTDLCRRVTTVVIKRGAQGVLAGQGESRIQAPARETTVVDSTGAGDAFTAGFLPVWRSGDTLAAAVDAGQVMAAAAVSRVGASPLPP